MVPKIEPGILEFLPYIFHCDTEWAVNKRAGKPSNCMNHPINLVTLKYRVEKWHALFVAKLDIDNLDTSVNNSRVFIGHEVFHIFNTIMY